MADGSFPTLISKDRLPNSASNVVYVNLSDETDSLAINADGSINVNATTGSGATDLGKLEDAVHASGDLGVMSLAVRNDTLATLVTADGDYAPLQVDADGALYVTGTISTSPTYDYAEDSVHANADVGAFVLAVRNDTLAALAGTDGDYAPFQVNASGALYVTVDGAVTVSATQLDIDDLNATDDVVAIGDGTDTLAINTDGSINVNIVDTTTVTGETHDYDTAAGVASDATSNHDYTVLNTTFLLKSVIVAGSGNVKFEIQTGPLASLATVAVGFLNGRNGDTKQINFDPAIEVPVTSTGTVRVIRTNRQGSSTDVYSTIVGLDI